MELAKIEITPLDKDGNRVESKTFKVLFNPNTYSITKTVTWSPIVETDRKVDAPPLNYGGGASRSLSLELFYDVTEPIDGVTVADVREKTNDIVKLTLIQRELKRPPAVQIGWGAAPPANSDFPFTGVVSTLTQRFTLFSSDGKPLRATLNVTFTEFLDPELNQRQTDPEFTTRRIKRGDTLSGIAAEVYRNPALWRLIAEANNLDDPRHLTIGQTLAIPKHD